MKVIAITQKGPYKNENEDRIVVGKSVISSGTFITDFSNGVIAIADGVGGNNAGAVASHFVAGKITDTEDLTIQKLSDINRELLNISFEKNEYKGMATTFSGVQILSENTNLFNIGNSRVYLLQGGKYLKQITKDDTTLNYLLATGQLSSDEAENFDRKNEITACFGGGNENYFKMRVEPISTIVSPIMITSDGVHDYLSIDEMEDILDQFGLSVATAEEMIARARAKGSLDDASIILGEV